MKTAGCHSNSEQSRLIIIGDTPLDGKDPSEDRYRGIENNLPPAPYPMAQNGYPLTHGPGQPYPSGNSPYPIANPAYPSGNPTYPIGNTGYPIGNTPYSPGSIPYPSASPPYPSYPSPSVPFTGTPGSNLGVPGTNLPYPVTMPALPPKLPSIGFKLHEENKPETAPLLPYPPNVSRIIDFHFDELCCIFIACSKSIEVIIFAVISEDKLFGRCVFTYGQSYVSAYTHGFSREALSS